MGHLDLRISENKDPGDGGDAPAKDGVTSQPSETSPKREDEEQSAVEKAPDVVSGGGSATRSGTPR